MNLYRPLVNIAVTRQKRLMHILEKKVNYLSPLLHRSSERTEQRLQKNRQFEITREQVIESMMEMDLASMQHDLPHSLDVEFESTITMEDIRAYTDMDVDVDVDVDVDMATIVDNAQDQPVGMATSVHGQEMRNILHKAMPALTKRIKKYHELFSQPLIAEFWEETLHNALRDAGYTTTWKPDRSHKVGEDMRIEGVDGSRISCKSGQFVTPRGGTPSVKFNGSRTTSQESIDQKIEHLCGDHDDWYFLLAKKKNFDNAYKLLVFESAKCKVNQLQWHENRSGKQWMGTGIFQASINKSMSAQLWTTFPMDMVTHQYDIVV